LDRRLPHVIHALHLVAVVCCYHFQWRPDQIASMLYFLPAQPDFNTILEPYMSTKQRHWVPGHMSSSTSSFAAVSTEPRWKILRFDCAASHGCPGIMRWSHRLPIYDRRRATHQDARHAYDHTQDFFKSKVQEPEDSQTIRVCLSITTIQCSTVITHAESR
jgi:hypothetical protein